MQNTITHRERTHTITNKRKRTQNNNKTYTRDKPMKQHTATHHTTNKTYTPKTKQIQDNNKSAHTKQTNEIDKQTTIQAIP